MFTQAFIVQFSPILHCPLTIIVPLCNIRKPGPKQFGGIVNPNLHDNFLKYIAAKSFLIFQKIVLLSVLYKYSHFLNAFWNFHISRSISNGFKNIETSFLIPRRNLSFSKYSKYDSLELIIILI